MFFKRKADDEGECRYCRHVLENSGIYRCKYKGEVSPGGSCRRYRFDPFAQREYRKRNVDMSAFDPLDFEI